MNFNVLYDSQAFGFSRNMLFMTHSWVSWAVARFISCNTHQTTPIIQLSVSIIYNIISQWCNITINLWKFMNKSWKIQISKISMFPKYSFFFFQYRQKKYPNTGKKATHSPFNNTQNASFSYINDGQRRNDYRTDRNETSFFQGTVSRFRAPPELYTVYI